MVRMLCSIGVRLLLCLIPLAAWTGEAPAPPGPAPEKDPAPTDTPAVNANTKAIVKNPIPDERCITWKPGIPGGIPKYPVFASVKDPAYGAKGDGKADDTAAIQKAINACPEGKAVSIPAGTYRLTTMLDISKGVALRGAGPDKTRLINEATTKHTIGINYRDTDSVFKIVKGYTKGSTSVEIVENTTYQEKYRVKPGDLVEIDQLNDPEIVDINGCGGACTWAGRENGKRAMGQRVQITARTGNVLTLSRPLYFTFKAEFSPELVRVHKPVIGAGVEDLYMENAVNKTDTSSPIKIEHGIHCWVKNIESNKTNFAGHVSLQGCLGCEIRDSYFHHTNSFLGGYGYGIWVFAHTSDTLVENNIFYYLHCGMMIESGGCGNVFGYNFCSRMFGRDYPATDWAHADMGLHGAHPYMNLFEGNSISTFGCDFYWGSGSHNTFFRNYADMICMKADDKSSMMAIIGVRLDEKNYFMNVVGNVLGSPGMSGVVEVASNPNYGSKLVWRLGYKTPSGGGAPDDPKTAQTLMRHGNFDFVSKKASWIPSIPSRKLPASLYLTAKPAFFGKSPWPIIGPDISPMVGSIPARARFQKLVPSAK